MIELYDILQEIKKRPGMFFATKSIFSLCVYIRGYVDSQNDNGKHSDILKYFNEFVAEYYNVNNQTWGNIIYSFNDNEEKAFDEFFNIFELFYEKYYEKEYVYCSIVRKEYKQIPINERHYMDHGNPKRCTNPHDHKIYWYPDNTFILSAPINHNK